MSEIREIQEGNLNDLLEEENLPMTMTFKPALSDSDSDGVEEVEVEEDDDEEKVDANAVDKAETVMTKVEKVKVDDEDEDEDEVDVDAYLIKALQSKVLIKKPARPLSEYISPNKSPRRKSPTKSPLPPTDLRWVIIREKQKIQEEKVREQMMEARRRLYEKEVQARELYKNGIPKKKQTNRPKLRNPVAKPLQMAGLCGCQDRCEWRGVCQNLFKNDENIDPNQETDLNKTI